MDNHERRVGGGYCWHGKGNLRQARLGRRLGELEEVISSLTQLRLEDCFESVRGEMGVVHERVGSVAPGKD